MNFRTQAPNLSQAAFCNVTKDGAMDAIFRQSSVEAQNQNQKIKLIIASLSRRPQQNQNLFT